MKNNMFGVAYEILVRSDTFGRIIGIIGVPTITVIGGCSMFGLRYIGVAHVGVNITSIAKVTPEIVIEQFVISVKYEAGEMVNSISVLLSLRIWPQSDAIWSSWKVAGTDMEYVKPGATSIGMFVIKKSTA